MSKYLIKRILRSLLSVVAVVGIVMIMVYSLLDKTAIFSKDPVFSKMKSNGKQIYMMQQWEQYGYLDYVPYADFMLELLKSGQIDQATYDGAIKFGDKESDDTGLVKEYVELFTKTYDAKGYEVERLPADMLGKSKAYKDGGEPKLYAYRNVPVLLRLWNYLTGLITVDNIHYVQEDIADRGLTFSLYDPAYGGEKFSPCIMGNGTRHKYLLYTDDQFPYIHQNLVKISLGTSYSINKGVDVFDTMTESQGSFAYSTVTYPSGAVSESADNIHSATYVAGSLETGTIVTKANYVDDYTNVTTYKNGLSKMGYSFTIGIISVILSYLLAIPLGITMALQKDKLLDKLGTIYIVFIIAVPSLAYIFLFKAIGGSFGLPTTFDMEHPTWLMYILPIISLALPSIANLMKWLRRYMIDQMNADYVKFARSGGLSEGEIFTKHVLKNAIIPIVHGIPGSVLGAMVGAIITERVYVVPGAGNLLTKAINAYDNGVIVGMALFYALLTVVSIILGDILMSVMDPRISFTTKGR
ncbi:MAG: ABC transporter permease [Oscillospiraceae bacterium]|nr:ABC transporter permease [Oscillospiraceae bacterium]